MKLRDVLCGKQIKGPALISLGKLTAAGYSFLLTSDDCFIFDEHLNFIKNVKRTKNYMYVMIPAAHESTDGGNDSKRVIDSLLTKMASYVGRDRPETATNLFGVIHKGARRRWAA